MRKIQKEKLKNIIAVFEEAIEEIEKNLIEEKLKSGINLLVDCQESGYDLIDFIEKSEGEDNETINIIDEYCKLIFEVHGEITSDSELDINSIIFRLKKAVNNIRKSIDENINVITEVLFLPYKASMWDSLESVWKAAKSDKKCNAVVMPIPYYDKNSDQSVGQVHYEGDHFPIDVPIVHYNQYDIKINEPDIIYIHNPYDNFNYVTSVFPDYYSENLKKYCELLVYIPYFSTACGLGEKNTMYISFRYIDFIVTQNRYVKSFYSKSIPEKKFLNLGSPKFDKILNTSKRNLNIPNSWVTQANNRKVYFFNTSIGGALADTDNYLKKIRYVFEMFEKNSKCCLLWRPHPLLEATLKSMRPQYYGEYKILKQYFIRNNLGIFDDFPDIDVSVVFSDVYIGDSKTSITSLFGAAGKPLFILNNKIHYLPKKSDLKEMFLAFPGDSRVVSGKYLFSPTDNNYSYKHTLTISNDEIYIKRACTLDGKTYLTHHLGEHILVVEGNKVVEKIELNCSCKGAYSFTLSNYLIITFMGTSKIIILNSKNHQVHHIEEYENIYSTTLSNVIKLGGYCLWNNHIVFSSPVKNFLLFVDTSNFKSSLVKVGNSDHKGYNSLVCNNSFIWCLPYEGNIIHRFDPLSQTVKEYKDFPKAFKFDSSITEQPFYSGAVSDNKLLLSPYKANSFISIDINTDNIEIWDTPFERKQSVKNAYKVIDQRKYIFEQQYSNDIYRINDIQNRIYYEINLKTKAYTEHRITFDKDEVKSCEAGFKKNEGLMFYSCNENVVNTLEDLLADELAGDKFDKEKQLQEFEKISENSDGSAGEKIHNQIIDIINSSTKDED